MTRDGRKEMVDKMHSWALMPIFRTNALTLQSYCVRAWQFSSIFIFEFENLIYEGLAFGALA